MERTNIETRDFIPTLKTGMAGLCGLIAASVLVCTVAGAMRAEFAALLMVLMTAVPMLAYDLLVQRTASANQKRPVDGWRCCVKFAGLIATLLLAVLGYWLFPEYRKNFYGPFFELCKILVPLWLVLALPYIVWVDRRMADPFDGYWHMGLAALGRWSDLDSAKIRAHLLGWLVKAFFLPLMSVFLINDVRYLQTHPLVLSSFTLFFEWATNYLFMVDLAFAAIGYSLTMRIFNSHIRSTESTALGWCSALVCYQPFWVYFQRLYFDYRDQTTWSIWLQDHPMIYALWGCVILGSLAVYSLATVCFGLRFSNLTHRGIIRFGPYYFTKHPAYVAKMSHHFLVSVPFVVSAGWLDATRQCMLFGLVALVYRVRARTEERHLSWDPAYRQYAEEVRQRHRRWASRAVSWVAGIRRIFPERAGDGRPVTVSSSPKLSRS